MAEQPRPRSSKSRDDSGFFAPYSDFAKALRTWFIAYGIGAPAFVLSNESVSKRVLASGCAREIAYLFLAGVTLQIIETLLYKAAMWQLYAGELDPHHKRTRRHSAAEFVSNSFALELSIDLGTLALFATATIKLLLVVLA
jgi:hypothetical protein